MIPATLDKTERPLVYCGDLIPKVWSGAKDITRRLMRPQPDQWLGAMLQGGFRSMHDLGDGRWAAMIGPGMEKSCRPQDIFKCPYGRKGDRLWVQESFRVLRLPTTRPWHVRLEYKADGAVSGLLTIPESHRHMPTALEKNRGKWYTGRFMPRWASRGDLEIVDIRPEWLGDITAADVPREGVDLPVVDGRLALPIGKRFSYTDYPKDFPPEVRMFAALWDSINHKRSPWTQNDMVWRIVSRLATGNGENQRKEATA
jgi:hypothetical protein